MTTTSPGVDCKTVPQYGSNSRRFRTNLSSQAYGGVPYFLCTGLQTSKKNQAKPTNRWPKHTEWRSHGTTFLRAHPQEHNHMPRHNRPRWVVGPAQLAHAHNPKRQRRRLQRQGGRARCWAVARGMRLAVQRMMMRADQAAELGPFTHLNNCQKTTRD